MTTIANTPAARYYHRATDNFPVEYWNYPASVADLRRIAWTLKGMSSQIVYGDRTCSTTAGDISDSLYRRAERLEKYGE